MDPRTRDREHGVSSHTILSALSSALAEWLVIFLLFIDGFLSYLVRRFARYSNLHPPCLICSNLDRILSQGTEINYDNLICYDHKLEIAASIRDTNFNGFKPKLEREHSCDDEERLIQGESTFSQINEHVPSKKEDLFMDHLPHIGYKEVKVTSDSDEDLEHEDISSEKETITVPLVIEDLGLIPMEQSEVLKPVEADPTHGLEELNWNVIYEKDHHTSKLQLASGTSISNLDEVAILDAGSVPPASIMEAEKDSNPIETQLIQVPIAKDAGSPMLNQMDLNDAYKMAIAYRMSHGSPVDSHGISEDVRSFMSQICSSRGLEISCGEMSPSPRLSTQGDDLKSFDASIGMIQRNLSRKYSFERNESGAESLDGSSMISEIEGENQEDRMKRQIEIDRKSMALLYKELEEERNASAISANQAMAMITRLQEEKAAMQMEALHYQRMMEEQSEYDQEALQKLNDALTQKEAELEDVKSEVQRYRKLLEMKDEKGDEREPLESSTFDFDDEKQYISEWLQRLDKKLCYPDHRSHEDVGEKDDKEQGHEHEMIEEDNKYNLDETSLTLVKVNGSSKSHEIENGSEKSTTDLSMFAAEVLNLNERLKALEDDRSFLEHIAKSLRHDDGAIQFVREIACHLQEIRRFGVKRRDNI